MFKRIRLRRIKRNKNWRGLINNKMPTKYKMKQLKLKAKKMIIRYVKNPKDQTKVKRTVKKKRRKIRRDFKMILKNSEMRSKWSESH